MKSARLAAAVLLLIVAARETRAEYEDPPPLTFDREGREDRHKKRSSSYAYSALGPGENRGAIAAGLRLFITGKPMIVPILTIDLAYTRNVAEAIDLDIHVSTLVIGTLAEAGARFKLIIGERFSFALRADAAAGLALGRNARATIGATSGALASFGTNFIQVTTAFDVALLSHDGLSSEAENVLLRPSIALEGPIDEGTNLFLQIQSYLTPDAQTFFPSFSIGGGF